MNEEQLKLLLVRDKVFLKSLYEGPNFLKNKEILSASEDNELNTLIKYLHFVANGKIPITKLNFEKVQKLKRLRFIQLKVESKNKTIKLLNSSRKEKLNFLTKLSVIYPYLLYGLFNLK